MDAEATVQAISLPSLMLSFVPVAIVLAIMYGWSLGAQTAIYAVLRMLLQLLAIGYLLTYIFGADQYWIILLVLAVMMFAAAWIAMRPLHRKQPRIYANALIAIIVGGVSTLILVTQGVLDIEPWYAPRYMVPLAGMIFASCMNTVSLAAERFESERANNNAYEDARRTAMQTSLIPMINSLFAVGLVSLPGMMTGQILSGVSPLIAARYQIVVMCMLFGSAGISAACYLLLAKTGYAQQESSQSAVN